MPTACTRAMGINTSDGATLQARKMVAPLALQRQQLHGVQTWALF